MSRDIPAQERTCASNKVVSLFSPETETKDVASKPKRCRPKKLGDDTPALEPFEFYAAQIARIPNDRRRDDDPLPEGIRGWNAAKDHARAVLISDRRLSPAAIKVGLYLIDHINHDAGFDWHSLRQIAVACCLSKKTVSDAMQRLRTTGHISRRAKRTAQYGWDRWDTTVPTLARASVVEDAADQQNGGTRRSTVGYPSIDGEEPVDPRVRAARQSTDLTSSSSQPIKKPSNQPYPLNPPQTGEDGRLVLLRKEVQAKRSVTATDTESKAPSNGRGDRQFGDALKMMDSWNEFARSHGLELVEYSSRKQLRKASKRAADIKEAFDEALLDIDLAGLRETDPFVLALDRASGDDFLMGRIPLKGTNQSFKFSFDYVLSSRRDVIADLLDGAIADFRAASGVRQGIGI